MDAASVLGIVVAAVAVATLGWGVYTARRGWSEDLSIRKADFVRNYTHDFLQRARAAEDRLRHQLRPLRLR